jgi:cytoskeletal protein CcmA (bactofilin family)
MTGSSIIIKGEISGQEDLIIAGRVEGRIILPDHTLNVATGAAIAGDVVARAATICGAVEGNLCLSERLELRDTCSVEGDLKSPRIVIAEGAAFSGTVDMPARAEQAAD